MNVASLELCKELYGYSADLWPDAFVQHEWVWGMQTAESDPHIYPTDSELWTKWPAYDLGYLLRKLPQVSLEHPVLHDEAYWRCWSNIVGIGEDVPVGQADTPEDAACLLAIALIKQGVL